MARALDSGMAAALAAGVVRPFVLGEIQFQSGRANVWSGIGTLSYNGKDWLGLGAMLDVGSVSEDSKVVAQGTTVSLAGIGKAFGTSTMVQEALADIRLGAPVKLWFGLMAPDMTIIGAPYLYFSGTVDRPSVDTSQEQGTTITLALEHRLVNLQRPSDRRYTSADQRLTYPTDSGFSCVEILNDIALVWGN